MSDPHLTHAGANLLPHELQNLEFGATSAAHFGHGTGNALPQLRHVDALLSLSSPHSGQGLISSAQFGQNLEPSGILVLHLSQVIPAFFGLWDTSKFVPHLPQNRVPGGLGELQFGHVAGTPPTPPIPPPGGINGVS